MTDLSDYELRVLRQMATGRGEKLVNGGALEAALEALCKRGLIVEGISECWNITEAGWRLVEEEANNGHR